MQKVFNLSKYKRLATDLTNDSGRGIMHINSRCMDNCKKNKADDGKSPQEVYSECLDEYNTLGKDKWLEKYA